jgi:hypothetical protein
MDTALVYATFGLVVVNIILVIVTFRYVSHTRRLADETSRMADIMVREYESTISPLIELKIKYCSLEEIGISISNKGKSPVEFTRVVFKWSYISKPDRKYEIVRDFKETLNTQEPPYDFVFSIRNGELIKEEFSESKNMSREELSSSISGNMWVCFLNQRGSVQRTRELTIKNLLR